MSSDYVEQVASAVRAEVARRNVVQSQLADVLGVPQAAVSRRLRGKTPITAAELLAIADFLGVPGSALLGEPVLARAAS